jgi:hypothetical protein
MTRQLDVVLERANDQLIRTRPARHRRDIRLAVPVMISEKGGA